MHAGVLNRRSRSTGTRTAPQLTSRGGGIIAIACWPSLFVRCVCLLSRVHLCLPPSRLSQLRKDLYPPPDRGGGGHRGWQEQAQTRPRGHEPFKETQTSPG